VQLSRQRGHRLAELGQAVDRGASVVSQGVV
jgi:hypothetical protein